jgi:ABC-type transport system involved in cytochrome c biogenesis permease subunit
VQEPLLLIAIISVALYIFGYYNSFSLYAGLLSQAAYIFSRGMKLGRLPLVGPHDTLFFLSASLVLFAIAISWRLRDKRRLLNSVVGLAVFFIFLSILYKPHNMPLPPVLRTFWFETHVAFSFFSYALFGIASVAGILYLFHSREDAENIQYKAILVGYFLFSVAMIFGGIWAFLAWGTYWLWTPKELWTVILWLFYSFYLHARLRTWWTGRPSVILGVIGFGIVMFTYLGVSLLMKSSHTF